MVAVCAGAALVVAAVSAPVVVDRWAESRWNRIRVLDLPPPPAPDPGGGTPATRATDPSAGGGIPPGGVGTGPRSPQGAPEGTGPAGAVTVLVVSTGTAGEDPADLEDLGLPPERARMADGLTDVIALVRVDPQAGEIRVLSIPRDLWWEPTGTRINALWNLGGPAATVDAVSRLVGHRPDHVVAVGMVGFARIVDLVGGVRIRAAVEVRDPATGLHLPAGECVALDGAGALALVRSRKLEVRSPSGGWRADRSASDFGRIARQHLVLEVAVRTLGSRDPRLVLGVLSEAARWAQRSPSLDWAAARSLALRLASTGTPEVRTWVWPAVPARRGAASVVVTSGDPAPVVAEWWSGTPPHRPPPAPGTARDPGEPGPGPGPVAAC